MFFKAELLFFQVNEKKPIDKVNNIKELQNHTSIYIILMMLLIL